MLKSSWGQSSELSRRFNVHRLEERMEEWLRSYVDAEHIPFGAVRISSLDPERPDHTPSNQTFMYGHPVVDVKDSRIIPAKDAEGKEEVVVVPLNLHQEAERGDVSTSPTTATTTNPTATTPSDQAATATQRSDGGKTTEQPSSSPANPQIFRMKPPFAASTINEHTICRVYSMTKPVVAAAILILYEKGKLQLTDPVHKYLPFFKNMRVAIRRPSNSGDEEDKSESRSNDELVTEPAKTPITIQHLLTHTSGLTYWFFEDELGVAAEYKRKEVMFSPLVPGAHRGITLKDMCRRIASCPLLFHPGSQWQYSNSFDVLGCVIEEITDMRLGAFLKQEIFQPLNMPDTGFFVPPEKTNRFAQCYQIIKDEASPLLDDGFSYTGFERLDNDHLFLEDPACHAGGGGLVSTLHDYSHFCEMLLCKGTFTDFQGKKHTILSRKTVDFMMSNHLDGDMADYGMPVFLNMNRRGVGFGLGGSVILTPTLTGDIVSTGEYAWGGVSSVCFWIDPEEGIACVFLTQLVPSSALPLRRTLRTVVNSCLL